MIIPYYFLKIIVLPTNAICCNPDLMWELNEQRYLFWCYRTYLNKKKMVVGFFGNL